MPQVHNGKMCYTFEEAQEIINNDIKESADRVVEAICRKRTCIR